LIPRIMGPLPQVAQQQPSPLPSPTSTVSETPPQPSPSPAPSQNKPPSPYRPPAPVYAVLLTPGGLARGGSEVTKVSLTSRAKSIDLLLIDSASYRSYRATLEQDGTALQTWSNLKPEKISLSRGFRIPIPFEKLKASQRYHIVLEGVGANGNLEQVHQYYFDATN